MKNKMREVDIVVILLVLVKFIIAFLITLNVSIFYLINVRMSTYKIIIVGDNPMIVYQGDKYVEPGYTAYDYKNIEQKDKVVVDNNVNADVIGNYRVVYSIKNFYKTNLVVREVNVLENPIEDVVFALKGEGVIDVARTSKYNELGFTVTSDKGDFTKNVTIENKVNTAKVGAYEVIYTLKIGNKEKSIKRIVHVTGDKYGTSVSEKELTNQNVVIKVENYLKDFGYFINPNGVKVTDEVFTFTVEKNGNYNFSLFDTNGVESKFSVNITNIDKKPPTGVCNSHISQKKTSYVVEATDENGIGKYVHNSKEYTANNFIVEAVEDTGVVSVYDKLGNVANINCNVEYEYIGPTNDNYKYKYESITLKYWIENADDYYKTTHIWVKDAYNQMRVAVPTKIGSLLTAKAILKTEIKNKGYENKGMVAVNASGIVGGGFGTKYTKLNPSWTGTAEIPLIINDGKIIRDSTNKEFPKLNAVVYGIKKSGYLGYYKFDDGTNIEENIKIKDQVISDGIRDTFGFYPVLVWDYKVMKINIRPNDIRQGVCQIDRNNFIIVTNTNDTNNRGKGFTLNALAQYMVKLGCKIGFNLDGGGSTNFYYKGNNDTINAIRSSNRGLVDILYFVEK